MSNIISFFQKLIKGGGVGIRAGGGLENFSKINKRGGTIIRYSRVHSDFCFTIEKGVILTMKVQEKLVVLF